MKIGLTGASGFVGSKLAIALREAGHGLVSLSSRSEDGLRDLPGCDAVVNLAGEPIAQRWTHAARKHIMESRVQGTRRVVDAMRRLPPQVLVNASAIGYYGSRGDEQLLETAGPGNDFLAEVATAWENEARRAEAFGVRVVCPRFGMVLGRGGALAKMVFPFKLGVGAKLGNGRQWMSWIHIDDLVRLIQFVLGDLYVRGAVNAIAPNPVTNAQFTRTLAEAVHKPAFLVIPGLVLKLALGEMSTVVLGSQRVIPQVAQRRGFEFLFPDLAGALADLL